MLKKNKLPEYFYNEDLIPNSVKETIKFINKHDIQGIKIHSTYVVKNTILEKMYNEKKYIPLSFEEYMNDLLYIISHINPKLIVHRICADPPRNILIAPEWTNHKKLILNHIDEYLKLNELYQGKFF